MTQTCSFVRPNHDVVFLMTRNMVCILVLTVTFLSGSRSGHAQSATNPFGRSTAASNQPDAAPGDSVKTPIERGSASMQLRPTGNSRASSPVWTFGTLTVLLAGIWIARTFARRRRAIPGRRTATTLVHVVESTPVDDQLTVHVLGIGSRALIVGASATGVTVLSEITDPEEVAILMGTTAKASRSTTESLFQDAQPIRQSPERRVESAPDQLSRRIPAPLRAAREAGHV